MHYEFRNYIIGIGSFKERYKKTEAVRYKWQEGMRNSVSAIQKTHNKILDMFTMSDKKNPKMDVGNWLAGV